MVGGHIAPSFESPQVCHATMIGWVSGLQVEDEAETLEVLGQVLQSWVAMVEPPVSGELLLD